METNNFWALKTKSSLYHLSNFPVYYPGHKLTVPGIPCKIHTCICILVLSKNHAEQF